MRNEVQRQARRNASETALVAGAPRHSPPSASPIRLERLVLSLTVGHRAAVVAADLRRLLVWERRFCGGGRPAAGEAERCSAAWVGSTSSFRLTGCELSGATWGLRVAGRARGAVKGGRAEGNLTGVMAGDRAGMRLQDVSISGTSRSGRFAAGDSRAACFGFRFGQNAERGVFEADRACVKVDLRPTARSSANGFVRRKGRGRGQGVRSGLRWYQVGRAAAAAVPARGAAAAPARLAAGGRPCRPCSAAASPCGALVTRVVGSCCAAAGVPAGSRTWSGRILATAPGCPVRGRAPGEAESGGLASAGS